MADGPDPVASPADPESATETPRWVKVFMMIGLVILVVFVMLQLLGGGGHGPGRHSGEDDPPATVIERDGGPHTPRDHRP